jgi:hypothetical protein
MLTDLLVVWDGEGWLSSCRCLIAKSNSKDGFLRSDCLRSLSDSAKALKLFTAAFAHVRSDALNSQDWAGLVPAANQTLHTAE